MVLKVANRSRRQRHEKIMPYTYQTFYELIKDPQRSRVVHLKHPE